MVFISFDPRNSIISTIGTSGYNKKEDKSVYNIIVTDSLGDNVYIPMILTEDADSSIPEMPYIEVFNLAEKYSVRCPSGTIREMRCLMDFKLHFIVKDNIDGASFRKKVLNELHDKSRTYQSTTSGVWFYTITGTRTDKSDDGEKIYYEVTITVDALYTDT
jgi:hypothetical protein